MARLPGAPDSEGLEEVLQAELFTFLSQVLDTDAAREAALAAAPALLGAAGRWVKEGPGPDGYDVPPPAPPGTANRFTAALRFLAAFSALVPFVTHPRYGQRVVGLLAEHAIAMLARPTTELEAGGSTCPSTGR